MTASAINDGSRLILKRGHSVVMFQLEDAPPMDLVSAYAEPLPVDSYCPICGELFADAADAAWVICRHWGQASEKGCRYCRGTGYFYLRWLWPMPCELCGGAPQEVPA